MLRELPRYARLLAGLMLGTACAALIGCQSVPPPDEAQVTRARATRTPQAHLLMAAADPSGPFEELQRPTPAPTATPTSMPTPFSLPTAATAEPVLFETGVASTYGQGDGFEGKRTACGQIFRTAVVQVAHKTLPCGTHVRIEDVATGNAVDADVTDRGPYIPG